MHGNQSQIKVKGSGQECPLHMNLDGLRPVDSRGRLFLHELPFCIGITQKRAF